MAGLVVAVGEQRYGDVGNVAAAERERGVADNEGRETWHSLASVGLLPGMCGSWQEHLVTKNTFLDFPSPWIDAEHRKAYLRAESSRPSSDPTSTSSSRASSVSSCSGSTGGFSRPAAPNSLQGECQPFPAGLGSLGADANVPVGASVAGLWTPGAVGHEDGRCMPCPWFRQHGSCRNGAHCENCHLEHLQGKKKRNRPPLRIRDPAKAENLKQNKGQPREKYGKHQIVLEDMIAQAHAEGDLFCIDAAEYIPKFVRKNAHLRQKFLSTLQKYREQRAPSGLVLEPPPVLECGEEGDEDYGVFSI